MKTIILGLLAETAIHPGMGRSVGAIDLPVAREGATDYPVLFGSGVKGALRDKARQVWPAETLGETEEGDSPKVKALFGKQDDAGQLLISDARLLLLPVRCLTGHYKWVTCPYLLERLRRDWTRAGRTVTFVAPAVGKALANADSKTKYFLEELLFSVTGGLPAGLTDALAELLPVETHEATRQRLDAQVVVLHDDDFAWFARYGLPVNARNSLDSKTKTTVGGALWYEETLPPDALFYALASERKAGAVENLDVLFKDSPYVQLGGNETVGQGWFAVTCLHG